MFKSWHSLPEVGSIGVRACVHPSAVLDSEVHPRSSKICGQSSIQVSSFTSSFPDQKTLSNSEVPNIPNIQLSSNIHPTIIQLSSNYHPTFSPQFSPRFPRSSKIRSATRLPLEGDLTREAQHPHADGGAGHGHRTHARLH